MQEIKRGEIILGGFCTADHFHASVLAKQKLRALELAVVIVAHREAVRTRIVNGKDVADLDLGQLAVDGKAVVAFAE